MSEMLLTAKNLTYTVRNKTLLDGANLVIHRQQKIALVGKNGAGKTTLMHMLQGKLTPDHGEIIKAKDLVVAELMQTTAFAEGLSCLQALQYPDHDLSEDLCHNLLRSFDLQPDHPFKQLSGGQKRRLLLAKAMQQNPDILFLDEPTNHLDIPSIHKMLGQLKRYHGTCFFVSHDRWLITQLADTIVDLDRGQITTHPSDFATYLGNKEKAYAELAQSQQLRKAALKREEHWLQRGVTGRRKRNQGRLTKLKALRETYKAWQGPQKNLTLSGQNHQKSGKKVLDIQNLRLDRGNQTLFEDFSYTLLRGEKIGIIGGNGVGKTSLLQCLLGNLPATSGHIQYGSNLQWAYFDQHRQQLDPKASVMDNVADGQTHIKVGDQELHVMSYLKQFLFSGAQAQGSILHLSGGEKNRLMLAKCLAKPANILVLDEPTNDLDIATLEVLEAFLVDYPGTVLIISHDQMFLDHIITQAWLMQGDGRITCCDGHLAAWQDTICKPTSKSKKTTPSPRPQPKPKKRSYHQMKRLEVIPQRIEDTEAKLNALYAQSQQPNFYQQSPEILKAHQATCDQLTQSLEALYDEWSDLEGD